MRTNLKRIIDVGCKKSGITQAELASIMGVPEQSITNLKRRTDCHISTAKKLADAFGVIHLELLSWEME